VLIEEVDMKGLMVTLVALGLSLVSSLAFAKWLPVHQIASEKPLSVTDGQTGKSYRPSFGRFSSNWQSGTSQAFAHGVAVADGGLYEFRLVRTKTSDDFGIQGLWDIYRDGLLVCDDCIGRAYGLDGAVGSGFKVYVGSPSAYAERWHFSGFITSRFDY
jgi:hypothetical protein